ncbi:hypothetical protein Hanom_Chr05g00465391 [Helianthus anomalus]
MNPMNPSQRSLHLYVKTSSARLYSNWQSKILERSNFPMKPSCHNHHTPPRLTQARPICKISTCKFIRVLQSRNKFFLGPCGRKPIEKVPVACTSNDTMKRAATNLIFGSWWMVHC